MRHRPFFASLRRISAAGLLLLAVACLQAATYPALGAETPALGAEPTARGGEGAGVFIIDPAASRVTLHLYREGLLSTLAHDHVMLAGELAGRVTFDPLAPAAARGQVVVPVAALLVDPPRERKRAGLEGEISPEDRAEVREAMLAPDQLDAERFATVTVDITGVDGSPLELRPAALTLQVTFRIKDREKRVPVAASVTLKGGTLTAEGEVELLQSDFGIEPYSVFLGTVAVQDRIRVRFKLVARRR